MRKHYVRSSDRSQWIEDSVQLAMEHVITEEQRLGAIAYRRTHYLCYTAFTYNYVKVLRENTSIRREEDNKGKAICVAQSAEVLVCRSGVALGRGQHTGHRKDRSALEPGKRLESILNAPLLKGSEEDYPEGVYGESPGKIGIGGRDWINLAKDRDRWRAYIRAVMNLRVP
ncbi:hypothetical protein ANN_25335 [Periplaneta americana]|uniref:Uncharacterized protein n=1 Tax=Periplaneta americana TaxID=6978 RepID=A0ABQ8S1K0_PERAM|nr:hypothetical protein ANN_25335 [Periplaneta americana]